MLKSFMRANIYLLMTDQQMEITLFPHNGISNNTQQSEFTTWQLRSLTLANQLVIPDIDQFLVHCSRGFVFFAVSWVING